MEPQILEIQVEISFFVNNGNVTALRKYNILFFKVTLSWTHINQTKV